MASDTTEKFKDKESAPVFKFILLFILFLAIGIVVGIFGSLKYLESRNSENINNDVIDDSPEDITKKDDYQELINNLVGILDANPLFYNSNGTNVTSMDNNTKLTLVVNRLEKAQAGTVESIASIWNGAYNCAFDFVTDPIDSGVSSNVCTVTRYPKSLFIETSKGMFNDTLISLDGNFNPTSSRLCVSDGDTILCGNINDVTGITGALESKFSVIKATKDSDGTIEVYEKGYLVDKRSNVIANGQYENYYLHSSDSTAYYYELRNADNLTFKHTFKTEDRKNYYYVSTVLYKE